VQHPQDTAGTSATFGICTVLYLAPHSGHSKLAFRGPAIWSNILPSAGVAILLQSALGTARFLHCSKSVLDSFLRTARIFAWEQGVADVSV
jgi:hypothetical protein